MTSLKYGTTTADDIRFFCHIGEGKPWGHIKGRLNVTYGCCKRRKVSKKPRDNEKFPSYGYTLGLTISEYILGKEQEHMSGRIP